MIVGIFALAGLALIVVLLSRNMMPTTRASQGDVGDLTSDTGYTADHGGHCGDHSGDCGDGGSH